MELTEREKKKLYEAAKAEMIKQAHGISIADKMIRISGERIKLDLKGRTLDAVYYPALSDDGTRLCKENDTAMQKAPLIVGFHGGGFLFGGCALNDAMWIAVSKALHSHIISVGYRKSPDHEWQEWSLNSTWIRKVYPREQALIISSWMTCRIQISKTVSCSIRL